MAGSPPRVIVLTGGPRHWIAPDLARVAARAAGRGLLKVTAVVASPHGPREVVDEVLALFPGPPPLLVTDSPDADPELDRIMDEFPPDLGVNTGYDRLLGPAFLGRFRLGVVNPHASALPHNRGAHQSFWGIMDNTPHGASLHWMDQGLDTGDLIAQAVFEDDGLMSAGQVHQRSHGLLVDLLEEHLPGILAGTAPRLPQPPGGSFHAPGDIREASTVHLSQALDGERLLRLARATDCRGHGFSVTDGQRTWRVRASVEPDDGHES